MWHHTNPDLTYKSTFCPARLLQDFIRRNSEFHAVSPWTSTGIVRILLTILIPYRQNEAQPRHSIRSPLHDFSHSWIAGLPVHSCSSAGCVAHDADCVLVNTSFNGRFGRYQTPATTDGIAGRNSCCCRWRTDSGHA